MDLNRQHGLGSPWVTVANLCGRNIILDKQLSLQPTWLVDMCLHVWWIKSLLSTPIYTLPSYLDRLNRTLALEAFYLGFKVTWSPFNAVICDISDDISYISDISDLNLPRWRHGGHSYLRDTACVLAECRFTIHYGHHCVFIINVSWKIRCLAKLTNSLKLKSFKLSNLVQDNYFYPLSIMLKNDSSGTRRLFKQMF